MTCMNRHSLTLLRDLYEANIAINAQSGGVLVLTTPQGVRLELVIDAGAFGRLYVLVQEFEGYVSMLTDCAQLPVSEASVLAWRLLLAGYLPIGDD